MRARSVLVVAASIIGAFGAFAAPEDRHAAGLRERAAALFGVVAPSTAAEVSAPAARLGRALFWDARLSLDGRTACASCHAAADWSSDRRPRSVNARGELTTLHSQPIFMSQDQFALRWYGDRRDGVHQAERSVTGSMGLARAEDMIAALRKHGYEAGFRDAFPAAAEPLSVAHYAQALAAYQRTLRTPAPFDAFLQGDLRALNARQLAGLDKFIAVGCAGCHKGALLGGDSFQKFGLVKPYWLATGSATIDPGRYAATQKEEDRYVYRVPMLRNVARTGPYFHDGSVATLEEAIRIMADVQLGRALPPQDVADIAAFLDALTGDVPAHYGAPAALQTAQGR